MHMHASHHPVNQPPSTCISTTYFWDMHEKCQAPIQALIQNIALAKDLIRGFNQRPSWAETLQPASANYLNPRAIRCNMSKNTGLGSQKSTRVLVQNSHQGRFGFSKPTAIKDPLVLSKIAGTKTCEFLSRSPSHELLITMVKPRVIRPKAWQTIYCKKRTALDPERTGWCSQIRRDSGEIRWLVESTTKAWDARSPCASNDFCSDTVFGTRPASPF